MKRLLVYSHDTYGLGNIRRMLAICQHLIESIPDLSILLVTGSPVIHSLRLPDRLDYIKLPCLTRTEHDDYSARFIGTAISETMRLRADLILAATANFRPDLLLVDKKPLGIKGELTPTFAYLRAALSGTKLVLVLRDILDEPEVTISNWERNGHYTAVRCFYDRVLVLGVPEVFDPLSEYLFPASVADKVEFCGYLRKSPGLLSRAEVRRELRLMPDERLVLVTPGGGQDGYAVIENYLTGLGGVSLNHRVRSLVICGPEMPDRQKAELSRRAAAHPGTEFREFTSDPMSYLAAADVVISMGGYNTVCEILSLKKKAIVIPRVRPTREQWIRAERMSRLGLFSVIHPDYLTPQTLINSLHDCLESSAASGQVALDLDALPRISVSIEAMLSESADNLPEPAPTQVMAYRPLLAGAGQYF
ncbi:MAG TPA: glycosyltransferase [Blastocatellia bacterium]|nr:glycosyltransferase [Blastocatellia bacterium]